MEYFFLLNYLNIITIKKIFYLVVMDHKNMYFLLSSNKLNQVS